MDGKNPVLVQAKVLPPLNMNVKSVRQYKKVITAFVPVLFSTINEDESKKKIVNAITFAADTTDTKLP